MARKEGWFQPTSEQQQQQRAREKERGRKEEEERRRADHRERHNVREKERVISKLRRRFQVGQVEKKEQMRREGLVLRKATKARACCRRADERGVKGADADPAVFAS